MTTTKKSSQAGLIAAIVFAAVAVSGSLVYFGMQLSQNNGGADKQVLAQLEALLKADDAAAPTVNTPPTAAAPTVPAPDESDHILGSADADITIITYSDFDCPFCQKFHPTGNQLVSDYEGKVNLVYRDFPLGIHDPSATNKAIASECVAKYAGNDAFWAFTDLLFETSVQNTTESLTEAAVKAGTNAEEFTNCYEKRETEAEVKGEVKEGYAIGVTGTPANYIYNNKTGDVEFVGGAAPLARFSQVIDAMLE